MAAFQRATMQVDDVPSPRRRVVRPARKMASSIGLGLERTFETKVSMTPPARLPGYPSASPFGPPAQVDFPATEAKRHALPRSQAFGPFAPLSNNAASIGAATDEDQVLKKGGLRRTVALPGHLYGHVGDSSIETERTIASTNGLLNHDSDKVQAHTRSSSSSSLADRFSLNPQHSRSRTSESTSGVASTPLHPQRRRTATTPYSSRLGQGSNSLRDGRKLDSSSPTQSAHDWRLSADEDEDDDDDDEEVHSDDARWSAGSEEEDLNTLRPGANFSCRRMSGTRSISTSHYRQQTAPSDGLLLVSGGEPMARSATTSSICECGCGSTTHASAVGESSMSRSSSKQGKITFKTPNKRRARAQGSSSSARIRHFSTASPIIVPLESEEGSLFGSSSSSSINRGLGEEKEAGISLKNVKRRSVGSLSHWQDMSTPLAFSSTKKGLPTFTSVPRTSMSSFARLSSDADASQDSPSRFAFDDSGVALQSPAASMTPIDKRLDRLPAKSLVRTSAKHSDEPNASPSKLAAARRGSSEHANPSNVSVSKNMRERSSLANETHFSDEASSNNSTPDTRRGFSTAASVPERLISPSRGKSHSRASLSSSSLVVETMTAPYLTPQTYKNVVPLQAAFMSTGLASKRSRPILGNVDPLTGESLPPLPAKLTYSNAAPTQNFQSSGNMAASLGLRDVVAAANAAHAAASANTSISSTMPDTPMKRPLNSFTHKGPPAHSRLNMTLSPKSNDENDSSSGGSMCGGDSPLLAQHECESPTLGMTSVMSNARCRSPMSMLGSSMEKEGGSSAPNSSTDSQRLVPNRAMTSSISPTKGLHRKRSLVRQSLPNQLRASEDSLRAQVMTRPLSLSRPPLGLQRKSSFGPTSDQASTLSVQSPLFDAVPSTPTRHSSMIKWYEAAQLVSTPSPSHRSRNNDASSTKRESWQANGSVRGRAVRNNSVNSASVLMPFASSRPYSGARPSYFETRFTVQGVLGKGEFSQVDKVEDKVDGVLYAVKRMKRAYLGPRDRLRRLEEVDILRYLGKNGGHPNIVAFLDAWEESGHLFVQTELCPCVDFSSFLQHFSNMGGSLDEARLWKVMSELKDGLRYIHDKQVLHLDLKPANIFITEIATLKIGDFGMATRWPPVDGNAILAGAEMGDETGGVASGQHQRSLEREGDREYIAPEIIQRGEYGKPADIFSLGLIMLEAAGNVILPDNGEPWQKLRSDDLSDVDLGQFSLSLVRLIRHCLQSDPTQRPTVEELDQHPVLRAVKTRVTMGVEMSELDQLPIFDLPSGESSQSLSANLTRREVAGEEHLTSSSLKSSTDTDMTVDDEEEDIVPCTPKPFSTFAPQAVNAGNGTGTPTAGFAIGGASMERTSSGRSALGLEGVEDDERVLDIRGALIYESLDFLLSVLEAEPDPAARVTGSSEHETGTHESLDSARKGAKYAFSSQLPIINVDMDNGEGWEEFNAGRPSHMPIRASPLRQSAHETFEDMDMDA